MQSKMTEVRDQEDSAQRNQSQRWIKNVVVVVLVSLLLFVLFKELHSLSNNMEESRKLLEELSNRLVKTEKENENLRKELGVTKAKVDKMMQEFPNMQKVSRFRRARNHHCHAWKHCMSQFNKGVNCTMIKNCMPRPTRLKEFIHVKIIKIFDKDEIRDIKQNLKTGFPGAQLSWYTRFPEDSNITFGVKYITISTGGFYYVYCRLRVSQYISKVIIKAGSSVLFSSSPTFANDTYGDYYGVVRMFGLAEIPNPGTKLYVKVQFKNRDEVKKLLSNTVSITRKRMNMLFPGYSAKPPEPINKNSFGVFLVS